VLEDAGIKLSCVATDVLGVSGRQMLAALLAGTRDPELLAELAKGKLRAKLPMLRRALAGDFQAHHALIVAQILAHLDYLKEMIATLTGEVEQRLAPFGEKVELLGTIPGVAARNSQVIIAELGPDMDRFATDRHAASWAGICPANNESAGQRRSGRPRQGNPYLRVALTECANAAVRTKNTYLRAQYEQVKRRRGHKKAIIAVAHSILIASYHILKDQTPYHDLGGDYFARRADPDRIAKRLIASSNDSATPSHCNRQQVRSSSQHQRDLLTNVTISAAPDESRCERHRCSPPVFGCRLRPMAERPMPPTVPPAATFGSQCRTPTARTETVRHSSLAPLAGGGPPVRVCRAGDTCAAPAISFSSRVHVHYLACSGHGPPTRKDTHAQTIQDRYRGSARARRARPRRVGHCRREFEHSGAQGDRAGHRQRSERRPNYAGFRYGQDQRGGHDGELRS